MAWSLIHAGWMHILLAVINAHDWTMVGLLEAFLHPNSTVGKYVTRANPTKSSFFLIPGYLMPKSLNPKLRTVLCNNILYRNLLSLE